MECGIRVPLFAARLNKRNASTSFGSPYLPQKPRALNKVIISGG